MPPAEDITLTGACWSLCCSSGGVGRPTSDIRRRTSVVGRSTLVFDLKNSVVWRNGLVKGTTSVVPNGSARRRASTLGFVERFGGDPTLLRLSSSENQRWRTPRFSPMTPSGSVEP